MTWDNRTTHSKVSAVLAAQVAAAAARSACFCAANAMLRHCCTGTLICHDRVVQVCECRRRCQAGEAPRIAAAVSLS